MKKDKPNIARDGAPKSPTQVKVHDGMYTMRNGQLHIAGVAGAHPLDDVPLQKNWDGKGNVPVHTGMSYKSFGGYNHQLGNAVFQEAGRLGKKLGRPVAIKPGMRSR